MQTAGKMLARLASSLAFASTIKSSLAADVEPADFNATQALIDQGLDVSAVPALADLARRGSKSGCSIAVGDTIPFVHVG